MELAEAGQRRLAAAGRVRGLRRCRGGGIGRGARHAHRHRLDDRRHRRRDPLRDAARPRVRRARSRTIAHNAVITDIQLGRDADGKVRYETTFTLTKPVDMSQASGFLWHDVPNRGGNIIINATERDLGDIGLASGWQADNAGATAVPANHATRHQPLGRGADGARERPARHRQGAGAHRQPQRRRLAAAQRDGQPDALPAGVARHHRSAVLTTHTKETVNGQVTEGSVDPVDRLGVRALQRDHAVPRNAGRHQRGQPAGQPAGPRLPQGRLRSEPALPGGLPRRRAPMCSASAWRRSATSDRSSSTQAADDFGTANPIAGTHHRVVDARQLAVGQLHAPVHLQRHEPGRGRTACCTTAPGRRSPAGASPPTCAGASPTASSSSTRWAAKARSGGSTIPTPPATCRRAASSIAAT